MRKVLVIAAGTMSFAAGPAHAQDIERALKNFDLVGTWFADCRDKTKLRWTFTGGENPTAAREESANDESGEGSIAAAEIVSPTKISLIVVTSKIDGKSVDPTSWHAKPVTALIEKVGNMIKMPSGEMLQKCVN